MENTETQKRASITIEMDEKLYQELSAFAKAEGRSMASQARRWIQKALDENAKG